MKKLITKKFIKQLALVLIGVILFSSILNFIYPNVYNKLFSKYSLVVEPFANGKYNKKKVEQFWTKVISN
jgi:hypothetical protein